MQTPVQERDGRLVAVNACKGGSRTGVQRMPLWTLVYTRCQSAAQRGVCITICLHIGVRHNGFMGRIRRCEGK